MSILEDNKAVARRYLQADALGFPDPEAILAPGFAAHVPSSEQTLGVEDFVAAVKALDEGLQPSCTIEDMVAEADRVAIRVVWRGSHARTFAGLEPTGRAFEVSGIGILRIEGGLVAERWLEFDEAGLLRQLRGEQRGNGAHD